MINEPLPVALASIRLVLSFDFGVKRYGLAIGQCLTGEARPLKPLPAKDGIVSWELLDPILAQWRPELLLVGIPLNMDDSLSDMSRRADKFRRRLAARYQLPAIGVDERLSSFAAKQQVRQQQPGVRDFGKHSVDGLAASLIFDTWLQQQLFIQPPTMR